MSQIYNDNTKRPKPKENQLGILGISSREFTHYVGNSAEDLQSKTERCWGYVFIFAEIFLDTFLCLYTSQNTHSKIEFSKLNLNFLLFHCLD